MSSLSIVSRLNSEEAGRLLIKTRAEKARRRLADFIRYGWDVLEPETPLTWNWHIDVIADHVQSMLQDWMSARDDVKMNKKGTVRKRTTSGAKLRTQNLVITVPPGTAKSRIVSVFAPVWMWLHCPSWKVLCLSANPRVAMRDSMYARDLIKSDWFQQWFEPKWTIRPDQDGKGLFSNTKTGFRASQGLTASITGERADAIFVDDALDVADAYSEAARKSMSDHWKAAGNRLNKMDIGIRISIQQRTHEDDLAGEMLRKGGCEHLNLPMVKEKDPGCKCVTCERGETVFGWSDHREEGDVLHPERFPPHVLEAEKLRLGSLGYASQYQQRPTPREGGLFKRKWIKVIDIEFVPMLDWLTLSVDAAFKKTEDGSRVSCLVIGGKGPDFYVVDNITKHMDFSETCSSILELVERNPKISRVLIEAAANGYAIISHLQDKVPNLIPIPPEGGKVARANGIAPTVEAGHLHVVKAPWADDYVYEICVFPMGSFDDQVDATSQCLIHARNTPDVGRFLSAYG